MTAFTTRRAWPQVLIHVLMGSLIVVLAGCGNSDGEFTDLDSSAAGAGFGFLTNPTSDYQRVDRMGMPAIATAVITSKDAFNAADPIDDVAGVFVGEIIANVTAFHVALDDDLAGVGLTPCAVAVCIAQAAPLVIPDTLKLGTNVDSGFPNGRRLDDPVIDVTLAVVLLDLSVHDAATFAGLPLNPPANDKAFSSRFPFLAAPHSP